MGTTCELTQELQTALLGRQGPHDTVGLPSQKAGELPQNGKVQPRGTGANVRQREHQCRKTKNATCNVNTLSSLCPQAV